ncbi:hypothetical protein FBEOM_2080 [Fusarium beomiforme]|uniref:Uncharacterized protein n=1 Tax=Fusarium beomiforme TaxID=44412 RepID=A0A9P5ASM0_9HYPO|nr:hypothetical protein FBEOM_2080 [Fusarium beomiforme]
MASNVGPLSTSTDSEDIFEGLPRVSQHYALDVKKLINKYPWEYVHEVVVDSWDINKLETLSGLLSKRKEQPEPKTTSLEDVRAALVAKVQAHHIKYRTKLINLDIWAVTSQFFPCHSETKKRTGKRLSSVTSERQEPPRRVRPEKTPESAVQFANAVDAITLARNLHADTAQALDESSKQPRPRALSLEEQSSGKTVTPNSLDRIETSKILNSRHSVSNDISIDILSTPIPLAGQPDYTSPSPELSAQPDGVSDNGATAEDTTFLQESDNCVQFGDQTSQFIQQQQVTYERHAKMRNDRKSMSKTRSAKLKAQIKHAEAEIARDQKGLDVATKALNYATTRINTATEDIDLMRSFLTSGQALYNKSRASGLKIGPTVQELTDTRRYLSESEGQLKIATDDAQELAAKMQSTERKIRKVTTKVNELKELLKKEENTEAEINKKATREMRALKLAAVGEKAAQILEDKYPDFFRELDEMCMPGSPEA